MATKHHEICPLLHWSIVGSDTRWASHIPYLFWSVNVLEQRRLNENISVAIRMRSCSGNTRTSSRSVRRQSSDDTSRVEQQVISGTCITILSCLTHAMASCTIGSKWTYWLCLEH